MEKLFQKFQGILIVHPNYEGVVCGYNDTHFILAVETKDMDFFRILKKDFYVQDEFKDPKYRYVFEDESTIERTLRTRTT